MDHSEAITFGTDGWRAPLETFTDDRVRVVAQAVADHLRETLSEPLDSAVVVGYDTRETSEGFAESVAEVLAGNGFDAVLPERDCPTPVAATSVVERDAAGAVVITASHNPPEYNGVKFIPADGAPALPEVTADIETHLGPPESLPAGDHGSVTRENLVETHAARARAVVAETVPDLDLSGLTVAYDAMHGSGRGVTDRLLESAGAEVTRLRCDDDPTFGGEPPEPSADHLGDLVETVREGPADIGVANDGDADRLAIVTPERGVLDENLFFAATYDHLLDERSGPAIRTVSTTFLIDRIAEAHGEAVIETAVGFKWVAAGMADHDALMGGEESGGFSLRGHVREKDGVLMALLACAAEAAESYDDRVDRLTATHGDIVAGKVSVDCPDDEKSRVVHDLGSHLPDAVAGRAIDEVVTLDGFKLLLEDGSWLLVRPSGTEPVLRVYAEADSQETVDELLAEGRDLVAPLV
ncbi:MAG: phosphoglucomutase/phosphomannomutase family protein [Halolamina sp.]